MEFPNKEFPNKKYQIIYCDCPWAYDDKLANDPAMGGITYNTMETEDIKNLPVEQIADKDCALFFWVTMPKLDEGLDVIKSWGFLYRTCAFVWVKIRNRIVKLMGDVPRIELFARQKFQGWDVWGLEAPKETQTIFEG